MPKAGGTSTLETLRRAYGDRFRTLYDHDPADPLAERQLDPDRHFGRQLGLAAGQCVHGHFHPGLFRIDEDTVVATVLRHPVENLISIHAFWRSLAPGKHVLHDHFLRHELSLVETARLPILRRLYSETYFAGFDMDRFDLIGRNDERASFFAALGDLTGATLDASVRLNATPKPPSQDRVEPGSAEWRELETILADDVRFFERHAR